MLSALLHGHMPLTSISLYAGFFGVSRISPAVYRPLEPPPAPVDCSSTLFPDWTLEPGANLSDFALCAFAGTYELPE